ncbi:MAG TPA: 2OG-Fe(II) oxygenase [Leucothrix mucor]|nr:2OG-Fe(II) oxygenase [Leucothrix mucor]
MKNIKEVKPNSFIFEYKNALPDFLCDDMIERFEANEADQYKGRVGSEMGANAGLKKTTDLVVTGKPHWQDVNNNLFRSLSLALREFGEAYPYFSQIQRFGDKGYNLQRYQPGEYYHWHVDGDNPELAQRQLVALWYLNDMEGKGGETEFLFQDVKITPKKGSLVLFPPFWTHEHRAAIVGEGAKYIATTWIVFRE